MFKSTGVIAGFQMYIDDVLYEDGSSIAWGVCEANTTYYYSNMTVVNTGISQLTVYIISYGPAGWVHQWQANDTFLNAGEKAMGELNLSIPVGATVWPDCGFYLRGE